MRVRSGDSFAIGGLLTTRTTQEDREIPLLARLPLIGGLFRRKSTITDETNLIIFITPRIVPAEALRHFKGSPDFHALDGMNAHDGLG